MAAKILVLGAGELGTAILTHLSALSPSTTKITVLLRPSTLIHPSPSQSTTISHLRSLGISFLSGDIATTTTPAELSDLFRPYDTIISCLGFASGPGSQVKITRAVLDGKVKRYVPWQFGVDYDVVGRGSAQDLWDEQLDVRDLLRSQEGTEWIVVSTGMFTSFLFEKSFGVVDFDEGVVRALGGWENAVTVTTPEDIGRLTSLMLLEEPRVRNQIVYTAGETISYGRLVEIVERVVGRKLRREVWSVEKLKEDLKEDPSDTLRKYRVVFAEGRGVSWDSGKTFNVQRGIEVTGVESFAKANLLQARR